MVCRWIAAFVVATGLISSVSFAQERASDRGTHGFGRSDRGTNGYFKSARGAIGIACEDSQGKLLTWKDAELGAEIRESYERCIREMMDDWSDHMKKSGKGTSPDYRLIDQIIRNKDRNVGGDSTRSSGQ